ncbi:hypothetical protein [Brucella rhizosphaerae]|uniref:DUF1382 family protein n=1 Tax=Brucella rhizosphaerae TaxID=571254 RepID=UPI0004662031|nr:hypothetical protein [Brucella rhizosphaerae]
MVSKVAQLREEMSIAQDLTKAHIRFVAVPVLNEADRVKLKMIQNTRFIVLADDLGEQSE